MWEKLSYYELPVRTNNDSVYGDIYIYTQGQETWAQASLQARGHGDEIMAAVIRALSEEAQRIGKAIRHDYRATNEGAVALAERTPGYSFNGTDENGNIMYERIYQP